MRASLAGAVCWLFLSPALATGQVATRVPPAAGTVQSIRDVREDYPLDIGPFYVRPLLQLKEFGIDTNVFNQTEDPSADFTINVSPGVDVVVPIANRMLVRSLVGADFVYYAAFESERSIDPRALVRTEVFARRLTLFGEGSHLNTRERLNYSIDLRARHEENYFTGGVTLRPTARAAIELAAQRRKIRFAGDEFFVDMRLQDALDRDTDTYSVTARLAHSGLTTFGLRYENQNDRFVHSPVRDTDSYRVMPGVELQPRALISGAAWVGYRSFTPRVPIIASQAGLVSDLALTYTLLDATIFGIRYQRDYQFSFEVQTPYYVDNTISVSIRRALGSRFDVLMEAARHHYDYEPLQVELPLAAPPDRVDTTDNLVLDVGYRTTRGIRAGLYASYWIRDSTSFDFRDYDGLRIGFTMTQKF